MAPKSWVYLYICNNGGENCPTELPFVVPKEMLQRTIQDMYRAAFNYLRDRLSNCTLFTLYAGATDSANEPRGFRCVIDTL